jgi:hypothetical protein
MIKISKRYGSSRGLNVPCFIIAAKKLGLKLPDDLRFQKWFEEQLRANLNVKSHEELEQMLGYLLENNPSYISILMSKLLYQWKTRKFKETTYTV